MMEKISNEICQELEQYDENIFYIFKTDGLPLEHYIVFNFWYQEEHWSNNRADWMFIDTSITVVDKNVKRCLATVRKIEKETDYNRIASYYDDETLEWVFILNKDFLMEVE